MTESVPERSPMDAETLEALRGSIAKWEAIVAGTGADHGPDNCTLCQKFDHCDGRPVAEAVGDTGCCNTPFETEWAESELTRNDDGGYWAVTAQQKAAAQAEVDFLRSLLPPGVES